MDTNRPTPVIELFYKQLNFGEMVSLIGYGKPCKGLAGMLSKIIGTVMALAGLPVILVWSCAELSSMHMTGVIYAGIAVAVVVAVFIDVRRLDANLWYALTDSRLLFLDEDGEVYEVVPRDKLLTVSSRRDKVFLTFEKVDGKLIGGGRKRSQTTIRLIPLTSLPSIVGGQDLLLEGKRLKRTASAEKTNPKTEYTEIRTLDIQQKLSKPDQMAERLETITFTESAHEQPQDDMHQIDH